MANKRSKGPTVQQTYKLAAAISVADADFIMGNSAGFKLLAAALAGNEGVVGIADEAVDNSGGAAGDATVRVLEGTFLLDAAGLVQADEGHVMYLGPAANTMDRTRDGVTFPVVGILKEFVSATRGWCQISAAITRGLVIDVS